MTTGITIQSTRTKGAEQWEQALTELYDEFLQYGRQAVEDYDKEAVHQARVGSRKLLTLLSFLNPEDVTGLRGDFKRTQKALGKVRDADVLIPDLRMRRKTAQEDGERKTAKVLKAVLRRQKAERKSMRRKLSKKLPPLLESGQDIKWNAFVKEQLPSLLQNKDVNISLRELEVAFEQQKKRCREILRGAQADSGEAMDELHRLRIIAKRIRYMAGAASFALDRKFYAYEEIYKEIQSKLGEITDKHVMLKTMSKLEPDELEVSPKAWDKFLHSLHDELEDALRNNTIIPFSPSPGSGLAQEPPQPER
ncbi:CHAD domain-containing protein [Paenibacillus sp. HN-1]|uniref:CHAD domain-containing protein n=1 Tax=Paenibacillus TaxID=44249 RepID=UPI001CA7D01D|nr:MULTISPECIES: CHAD domain-containing protein [Paenibacillus]MBY9079909.1 CHAD domain-containing protein [Paenibacillus sp. CGMCC 1.18879]MBY9084550.1 CHAD domain-containing protein [Paenibacillus sinensis]